MSANAPYVLNRETSPRRLRLLIARNPEAMSVFRNVVDGEPLGNKVFVEGSTSKVLPDDDPTLEFLITKLTEFSLIAADGAKFKALYSDILIRSDSFTPDELRAYALSSNRQTQIALRVDSDKPATVLYFVGSLSKEDFAGRIESISTVEDKYRDRPNGEISYVTSFICKQL